MLALKVLSTVFLGISCLINPIKTILFVDDVKNIPYKDQKRLATIGILYGWLWRALVIVTIWIAL